MPNDDQIGLPVFGMADDLLSRMAGGNLEARRNFCCSDHRVQQSQDVVTMPLRVFNHGFGVHLRAEYCA